ncbi:2'-5' RNA ligase family protein [Streptomyces sp. NPDC014891]|uniref:2'-5' RNA ligase family protein n=1 Tax=Streptomyces sp. NPDC014891 TaxID=3364929 RepID=UPI0037012CD2
MADDTPSGFQAGQTALIVRIPEAEPAVRAWRERFGGSARVEVPAHVTVLFPFLEASRVDTGVHAALADVLGGHPAFDVRFERCGRFPGVLHLVPEPDAPFRRLTEAIVGRWPEAPPYGGRFGEVVPHLTVAQGEDDAFPAAGEADFAPGLPFSSHVSAVELIAHDGVEWRVRETFPLAGPGMP